MAHAGGVAACFDSLRMAAELFRSYACSTTDAPLTVIKNLPATVGASPLRRFRPTAKASDRRLGRAVINEAVVGGPSDGAEVVAGIKADLRALAAFSGCSASLEPFR